MYPLFFCSFLTNGLSLTDSVTVLGQALLNLFIIIQSHA